MKETKYLITENMLLEILENHYKFIALESGGVDNWEWYSDSFYDFLKDMRPSHLEGSFKDYNFKDLVKDTICSYAMEVGD